MVVTFNEFTKKMNEALLRDIDYKDGMVYSGNESGLKFVAPALGITENMALHKKIYDRVSETYTVSSDS